MVATVVTVHPIKLRKPNESFLFELACSGGGLFGWTVTLSIVETLAIRRLG